MNVNRIEDDLNEHGCLILGMKSGQRYKVYRGDVEFTSKNFIVFDCGDEEYRLSPSAVESTEKPHSDRME